MKDQDKSKKELINELENLRRRVSELEGSQARPKRTQRSLTENGGKFLSFYENDLLKFHLLHENFIEGGEGITGRGGALESLDRANQLWELTFNAISDGIMVLDLEHRILRANEAMASVLGMSESELTGKHCYELVHQEPQPPVFCPHSQLIADGEAHSAEVVEPCLGATLDVRVSPILDREGRVMGSVHVIRDISDRKRVEQALLDSEERLRLTLEATQIGIWDWDLETDQWYASPMYYAMLGYEPKTGLGDRQEWLERVHPDDRAHVAKKIKKVLTKDFEGYQYEARLRHADGTFRWQHVRGMSVKRDEDGKVTRMLGIRMDINERKRVEEALRESEELHRITIGNIADTVLITDDDGAFTYVCPNTHIIFGYSTEEVKALGNITRLIGHTLFDQTQLQNSDEIQNIETTITDKGGREHTLLVNVRRVDIKGGTVLYTCRDITERKRAEEAERNIAEKYRNLFEESFDGLFVTSPAGKILDINNKGVAMFGYDTKEEMLSLDIQRDVYAYPEDRKRILSMISAQGSGEYEVVVKKKSGEKMTTSCYLCTEKDKDGRIIAYRGVIRDVTERKKAEEALRAASLYNRSLIEASLDPLVTISAQGKITDVNKATELITGYAREELIGTDFADYFTDPEKARGGYRQAFAEGVVEDYELEIRHRNGKLTPVMYNASVYRDSFGKVVGLFAAARDISRSKKAEEKNLWLAAIVESSDDAIIGKTLDGIITSWNKGAASIYGYRDTEIVGEPIYLIVPPDRRDEVAHLIDRLKRGEHIEHYETVRRKKNGDEIDVSLTISPIKNAEGAIVGASTIARDITEQKSLQRQLLQAQKMESIGTLAGGIAHDFNNILTVVLGFSELLLIHRNEKDPIHTDLKKINQAARNGAELVQSILAFSRKTEINPRALNLNREIEQAGKLLTRTIPKMIQIELALSDELTTVNADPVQIEQILMNLAVNARDAMPDGGRLTVATKNVDLDDEYCRTHLGAKPGDYVLLSVSDTGHGMDKETLNRIFEPFYTTKGIGRGTGLGLAIVYGIVKQHGGYITCSSEPGVGTTFEIYLPVIPTKAEQETAAGEPVLPMGTETILLVDDEELVRSLGKRILEPCGYTVLSAANGREALDLYRKEISRIGLVILDIMMPEMGGKECLQNLQEMNPQIKVLIASGYTSGGTVKEATELGAKGFVRKPYEMEGLLRAVRQVLDHT